jgi:hypothetical protein
MRPDLIQGVPIWVADPIAPGRRKINRAAFQIPPGSGNDFTRQGTLGRNVVRLPGLYQVNMALRRQFKINEKLNVQLKAEAFNIFNHPLFGFYETNLQVPARFFGIPQDTLNSSLSIGGLSSLYQLGGSRSMQFSARLNF